MPSAEEPDLPTRCLLLLETSADDSIIVSTTAARLHGLWLPPVPDDVHLATAAPNQAGRRMTRTRRPEVHAHRRQLPESDRAIVGSVAVTSIARTWRDLAPILELPALIAAGDRALQLGVTAAELFDVADRTRRHRGAQRALAALPLLDARSRSRPESHLRVAVSVPDLPEFAVNEPVYRREGGWLAEPDLSLSQARIALEYQGADHADPRRIRKDMTRAVDLRGDDWLVCFYGPAEVFGRPLTITTEVRRSVRERAPQLLRPARRRRVVT